MGWQTKKLFSTWQDAQPALPVGTDWTTGQTPVALEINNADDSRIRSDELPPLWKPSAPGRNTRQLSASGHGGEAQYHLEHLGRKEIREFLDWVHEDAAFRQGIDPGRTTNKVRSHLRAVLSWAWEHDLLNALPRFPKLKRQRDVAGRHYLTKPEMNALYFATHQMKRLRGWSHESRILAGVGACGRWPDGTRQTPARRTVDRDRWSPACELEEARREN